MIAFTGPVRQVETAPTKAVTIEPAPQAAATASTGGECPAERGTVMPCPFCTTSTVIASGTTSSTIARQENAGAYKFGCASATDCGAASNLPITAIAITPTASAPMRGGTSRASRCEAPIAKNAAIIGAAIQNSSRTANTDRKST